MKMKSLKHRITIWLYRKFKKAVKRQHLDRAGTDLKCPNCNEWFSITGVSHKYTQESDEDLGIYECTCGQCKHTSNWSPNIAPCLIRVINKGVPVHDYK